MVNISFCGRRGTSSELVYGSGCGFSRSSGSRSSLRIQWSVVVGVVGGGCGWWWVWLCTGLDHVMDEVVVVRRVVASAVAVVFDRSSHCDVPRCGMVSAPYAAAVHVCVYCEHISGKSSGFGAHSTTWVRGLCSIYHCSGTSAVQS